jgi:hypothetical protein
MKDVRGEVREFLSTRRAKVTPEQAGLPRYGGRRRVAGLRRDEVAQLAGISIEYYTRLNQPDSGLTCWYGPAEQAAEPVRAVVVKRHGQ